jgi:hypothetical protein
MENRVEITSVVNFKVKFTDDFKYAIPKLISAVVILHFLVPRQKRSEVNQKFSSWCLFFFFDSYHFKKNAIHCLISLQLLNQAGFTDQKGSIVFAAISSRPDRPHFIE